TVGKELLADPRFVIAGVAAPRGRARTVEGGYRVTGRWSFASGSHHARWLVVGAVLADESSPGSAPVIRHLVLPADEVTFHDTWQVAGLRGTGSDDLEVHDVFVPAQRSFSLFEQNLTAPGPLYAFPILGLLALGIGATALGIGRAALDE